MWLCLSVLARLRGRLGVHSAMVRSEGLRAGQKVRLEKRSGMTDGRRSLYVYVGRLLSG
jgi:hypothetical protein